MFFPNVFFMFLMILSNMHIFFEQNFSKSAFNHFMWKKGKRYFFLYPGSGSAWVLLGVLISIIMVRIKNTRINIVSNIIKITHLSNTVPKVPKWSTKRIFLKNFAFRKDLMSTIVKYYYRFMEWMKYLILTRIIDKLQNFSSSFFKIPW